MLGHNFARVWFWDVEQCVEFCIRGLPVLISGLFVDCCCWPRVRFAVVFAHVDVQCFVDIRVVGHCRTCFHRHVLRLTFIC